MHIVWVDRKNYRKELMNKEWSRNKEWEQCKMDILCCTLCIFTYYKKESKRNTQLPYADQRN